jgi:putative Ca2+/H+ antiporter (TMEM165/GDT1 family)
MEPEVVLGLSLFSLLAVGLGTQLARQGAMQYVFLLAIGLISLFVMAAWWQVLTSRKPWSEAERDW